MKKGRMRCFPAFTVLIAILMLPALTFGKETAQSWELVNPEGVIKVEPMKVNPHPSTLEGQTVVLRWNGKHNGNNFLNRVSELLTQQVKDVKIIKAWEVFPETPIVSSSSEKSKDFAKKIASLKPAIVIASQADWGSCTSWLVVDQLELEKLGIPTVTAATTEFVELGRTTMASMGAPDMAFVVVSHPMGGIKLQDIQAKANSVFPEILRMATQWKPSTTAVRAAKPAYPAEKFKFKGTGSDVTNLYYKRKWSDGLPIVPPTPERVKQMLGGTTRKPDEVIGIIQPRMGVLTVELAATHTVMAGAKPQYLPVILAAAEALLDPRHDWRSATTTTNPCAPFIVVNGPIVKELGIQNGTGALAPGPLSEPNATIGRAINLIMDIVGGSQPPSPDKSTLGTPASYTMVVGENEGANPWATLSVQQGAKPGTNTVTVFEIRSFVNFNLHEPNTAEGLLHPIAKTIGPVVGLAENGFECKEEVKELLVLSPEHADTIFKDGWNLERVKNYLFETSRISMADYMIRNNNKKPGCRQNETTPTVVAAPGCFLVMVAGGEGKHSVFMETTRYVPVTKEIKK